MAVTVLETVLKTFDESESESNFAAIVPDGCNLNAKLIIYTLNDLSNTGF